MNITVRKEPSLYAAKLWWVVQGKLTSIIEWEAVDEDEDEDMSGATEQEFGR